VAGAQVSGARSGRAPVRAVAGAAVGIMLFPRPAWAHLVTTGLGPVFDGIGHLFVTVEDLLPVLAITLFAGLRGREAGRGVLFALPTAWLAAGIVGLWLRGSPPAVVSVLSLLVCGGVLAANAPLPTRWVTGLAVLLGMVHGTVNGAAMAEARLGVLGLLGVAVSLFVVAALMSALVVSLSRPWMRIAVRVAGSWVVATGLLLLGWSVRMRG